MNGRLLWCDCETTGLDERQGSLLEVALVLTEGLRVVAETQVVIHDPGIMSKIPSMDPWVVGQHRSSGLFTAVLRSPWDLGTAEQRLLQWVLEHDAQGLYMAGSGVGFDRRWLRHCMPALYGVWHYRDYDMTTLRRFFGMKKGTRPHRALEDLRADIRDARLLLTLSGVLSGAA